MYVARYSAVEMFGAPVDRMKDLERPITIIQLLEAYDVEPREIEPGPIDITPPYWKQPKFRHFLSRVGNTGAAVVDLLPAYDNAELYVVAAISRNAAIAIPGVRSVEIPTEQPMMVIAGASPRFAGKICIHEAIVGFS